MKKVTEIIFEVEETLVVRQPETSFIAFCSDCEMPVEMISPRVCVELTDYTEREIFRLIEAGKIHFVETDKIFVCRRSLTRNK